MHLWLCCVKLNPQQDPLLRFATVIVYKSLGEYDRVGKESLVVGSQDLSFHHHYWSSKVG